MLLPKMIGYFKMNSSKEINRYKNVEGMPFWQRNYYEHVIIDDWELYFVREYIGANPANWLEDGDNPFGIA